MSFKIASKFREGSAVVNKLSVDKLPLLLQRLLKKLHTKNTELFNESEREQLKSLFGMQDELLAIVFNLSSFIFEQAAFTSTGPDALNSLLLEAGFDESHASIYCKVWAVEAPEFVAKLKNRNLGSLNLLSSDYHLHLTMSDSTDAKKQDPTAVFSLQLGKVEDEKTTSQESVILEFNHPELFDFFQNLDRIQQQLDSLS